MAKKDATNQGALDQETDTGVQATHNPRYDFMEQLAEKNHEAVKAELADAGFIESAPAAAPDAPAPAAATNNNAPHVLSEDELVSLQVKTKIDGIEEIRPVSEVLKSYQKDSAASKRLEEAARRQAELDAREQELRQREEALLTRAPQTDANLSNVDDVANELVTSLYEGDEEKTKEAIKRVLMERPAAATPQPAIDPAALAAEVERQLETKKAFKAFGDTFSEIVADPYLAQVADTYLAQELQDGVELNAALTNAGNKTRERVRALAQQLTTGNSQARADRKSGLDHVQPASIKSTNPEAPIDGANEASSVIAEMRKARGLPV